MRMHVPARIIGVVAVSLSALLGGGSGCLSNITRTKPTSA